jgi:hypothetical protein
VTRRSLLSTSLLWSCLITAIGSLPLGVSATESEHPLASSTDAMPARDAQHANIIDLTSLTANTELAKRLQRHIAFLASHELRGRKPGTPGNRAAADYIAARFRELGLEPLPTLKGYAQEISPGIGDNLIAVRPATRPLQNGHAGYILVGAHYDHLGGRYLGADDNASAIAILLETARLLPALSDHSVLFVAFNAEEPPYIRTNLMGSQHFVDHLPAEIGQPSNFHAVVIMDLMGGAHWTPLRDVVFAAGAESSPALYQRLKQSLPREALGVRSQERRSDLHLTPHPSPLTVLPSLYRRLKEAAAGKELGVRSEEPRQDLHLTPHSSPLTVLPLGMHLVEEIPLVGRVSFSDYDAFRNASVPYLFLSAGRTPRYHQPTDLPNTLHYERMAETVSWLQIFLQLLDQDTRPYGFESGRLEFVDEVAALRPLAAAAAQWNTRIPGTSPVSLLKLKLDERWLKKLDATLPTTSDIKRLEKLSIRLQCLLADFYGCAFL